MKNLITLLTILIFLIIGCKKQSNEKQTNEDFRKNYIGVWEFTTYSYMDDMVLGHYGYDTVSYKGVINDGVDENDLFIQFTENDNINVTLDIIPHFHFWFTSNCNGSGEFDGNNKIHIYYSCGSLSKKNVREIIGEKKSEVSQLNNIPNAKTIAVKGLSLKGVMLMGVVNPNYLNTNVVFEYGTTSSYGNKINAMQSHIIGHKDFEVSVYVTNLVPGTLYHYRVIANNLLGTSKGVDTIFTTLTPTDPITDIEGNVYHTIPIGSQVWMTENLKTTKYSNGDAIATTSPSNLDITNENSPKYQWSYNGNEQNVTDYGRLYTMYTVTDSRNVCPVGWHVPLESEWEMLLLNMGKGDGSYNEGNLLKEAGTKHWISPNEANNYSGFTALPGGCRISNGLYTGIGESGNWWFIPAGYDVFWSRSIFMGNSIGYVYQNSFVGSNSGFSIRCLKN